MKDEARQLEVIAAVLREESTIAVATANEHGEPSVAPLFYIADAAMNLYWFSSSASRHSLNLGRNRTASATVFRPTEKWKEICGVQMRGQVEPITAPRQRAALVKLYCQRFDLGSILSLAIRRSTLYIFRPHWFRYIDNSKHFGYSFEVTRNLK